MTTSMEWQTRDALQRLDMMFNNLVVDSPGWAATMAKAMLQLMPAEALDRHMPFLTAYCRRRGDYAPQPMSPEDIPGFDDDVPF